MYYPDFYLPDAGVWVEVKGKKYIRPDDKLRIASVDVPCYYLISNEFSQTLHPFLEEITSTIQSRHPKS